MSICRVAKTKNYTVMSNTHLRDTKLSLKAIGLLSKVLSLPDEWDYSKAGLCAICKEGISAIDSAMSELREFGYLRVDKLTPDKTSSGRIEYIYTFFEIPEQGVEKQGVEKQGVEKQGVEVLDIEKHAQLNKDLLSKEELSTDELNKEHTYTVATATDHTATRTNKTYNYEEVRQLYESKCKSFNGIRTLSDDRKRKIKTLLNNYDLSDIEQVFEKAEQSEFLKGKNSSGWTATFDWLIKPANFLKVLEGNYDSKGTKPNEELDEWDILERDGYDWNSYVPPHLREG